MPRYKLLIEYDGTPYSGWQWQENGLAVQQVLETAIEAFAGHKVRLFCAGRTDAGVHATGQVVHVDLEKTWRPDTVRDATNAHVRPHPISVLAAEEAAPDFNARTHATGRRYLYRILNRRPPPAIEATRVWHVPGPIDVDRMAKAAATLLGHHDFTTFRAGDCQAKSPIKTLDRLDVERIGEEVRVHAAARSFLHHQVRSMVGTIAMAGLGRWSVADVRASLDARDRRRCGPMAPAAGLYLVGVEYGVRPVPAA